MCFLTVTVRSSQGDMCSQETPGSEVKVGCIMFMYKEVMSVEQIL